MGVRETVNQNRALSIGAVIAFVALAFLFLWWQWDGGEQSANAQSKAFFSDDDGKTWFIDDIRKIPPFQHNGKPADRAYVFTCDGGKTKWVGYLERFTPAAKEQMEDADKRRSSMLMGPLGPPGRQLKTPGAADWTDQSNPPQLAKVMGVSCPHDGRHPAEPVLP